MVANAVAVFFGGALGALSRFLFSEFLPMSKWGIPFTIMFVNFSGCFVMGALDSFFENQGAGPGAKHFLMIGFLGGFTTFSAFSLEFANLMKNNGLAISAVYVVLSVFTALFGFFAGYMLVKAFK